jgi:hypothetical protein
VIATAVTLAVVLGATPAAAAPFRVEELPAGGARPRVLLAPREGTTATLAIRFAVGSADDGDGLSGLTRVAQHALLAANAALDAEAFTIALHAAGARLSVSTGLRECAFVLTAPSRDFPALAGRLASAVLAPRLDRRRFRGAVERALHDVREPGRGGDLVTFVTATIVDDLRYQNEPFGDRGQIEQIEPEDVAEALAGPLSPANATVVVAGAFDRSAVVPALARFRGGERSPPAAAAAPSPLTTRNPTGQELLVVAVPVTGRGPRESAAVRTLATLVEDLLWRDLRGAGTAYALAVAPVRTPPLDVLLVVVPAPASAEDARRSVAQVLDAVRVGRFDGAALARARATALARLRRDDARPEALAAALLSGGTAWHGPAVEVALAELARGPFLELVGPWLVPEARAAVELVKRDRR